MADNPVGGILFAAALDDHVKQLQIYILRQIMFYSED